MLITHKQYKDTMYTRQTKLKLNHSNKQFISILLNNSVSVLQKATLLNLFTKQETTKISLSNTLYFFIGARWEKTEYQ